MIEEVQPVSENQTSAPDPIVNQAEDDSNTDSDSQANQEAIDEEEVEEPTTEEPDVDDDPWADID